MDGVAPERRPGRAVLHGLLLVAWAVVLGGCSGLRPAVSRFEFESVHMAIPFRIVVYARRGEQATNATRKAFARIEELNGILSDYESESELSRLSRTAGSGQSVPLGADLERVLVRGQTIAEASGGAFDVTAGPVIQLWRRARRQRALPAPERLEAALGATGWEFLQIDRDGRPVTARLTREGMRLDLGGIAKGYALDEAATVLRRAGLQRFLIAGAGDLLAGDPPPGKPGWQIEVAALDVNDAPSARTVSLRRASLCTSGDLFQHVVIDGTRYSHIVDPRTGIGLTDHSLVTVIGPDAMTSDALATALSVAGADAGLPLARRFGCEALIVRRPDTRTEWHATPGFPGAP